MWWVVVTTHRVFVAKGWRQDGFYHIFQAPLWNTSSTHQLCTPSEWVTEIVSLLAVTPQRLPAELVRLIGAYM